MSEKAESKKAEEKKPDEKHEEGHGHEEGEAKGKKKKLPMLWIIMGLLTVLGSAGGTFLFMFMKGGGEEPKGGKKAKHVEASHDEEAGAEGEAEGEEAHSEEAAAHGEEEGGHGEEEGGHGEGAAEEGHVNCPKHEEGGGGHGAKAPVYTETFSFEPFIVNLAGEADKNFLKVVVKLRLAKPECTPLVEPYVAEMRDSILLLLSSKNYDTIKTVQGKMELRDEVLERVQHIVKGGRIKAVFFTDFVAQ